MVFLGFPLGKGENESVYYSQISHGTIAYIISPPRAIEGADPKSFRILPLHNAEGADDVETTAAVYAADAHSVFLYGERVPFADPNTFEAYLLTDPLGRRAPYGRDNNHVYTFNDIIKGADAATFEVLDSPVKCERYGVEYFCLARDKNGLILGFSVE
ncbi:MAG: DKNYY domain-containing protein [Pseudomonadota bacterium]